MATRRIQWQLSLQDRASAAFSQVADSAQRAEDGAQSAAAGMKNMEDATGQADSILQGLAGAVDRVVPGLGDLMRGAGDAAGGMEAMAKVGPGLIGVLGGVGLGVAALAGIWELYSRRIEEVEQRQQDLADQSQLVADTYLQLQLAMNKLLVTTGELAAEEALLFEARARADALLAPRVDQLNAEIERTKELLEVEKSYTHGVLERAKAITIIGQLMMAVGLLEENRAVTIEGLEDKLAGLELQSQGVIIQKVGLVEATVKAAEADENATRTTIRRTAALKELNDEFKRQQGLRGMLREAHIEQVEFQRAAFSAEGTGVDPALTQLRQIAEDITDLPLNEQAEAWRLLSDELDRAIDATEAAREAEAARAEAIDAAWRTAEDPRFGGRGVGMAAGAATGEVGGLLSAAGPWGAIIGAALAIGTQGADAIGKKLDGLQDAVSGFFQAMPQLIGQVVPQFIAATMAEGPGILVRSFVPMTVALTGTIIKLPFMIVESMIRGLADLFRDGAMWKAMVAQMVNGFKAMIRDLLPSGQDPRSRSRRRATIATTAVVAPAVAPGLTMMAVWAAAMRQSNKHERRFA